METLRAERAVIDSELRNANVDMKSVFLSAAAGGGVNEPVLSVQHLDRAYSGLQDCVFEYPYCYIRAGNRRFFGPDSDFQYFIICFQLE